MNRFPLCCLYFIPGFRLFKSRISTAAEKMQILASGFIKNDKALKVFQIGNEYTQLVIKSEKAADSLKFIKAEVLLSDEIEKYQSIKKEEERLFQEGFQKIIGKLKF